jgi:hypothetical protein
MLKPVQTKTARASGGTFAIVALQKSARNNPRKRVD